MPNLLKEKNLIKLKSLESKATSGNAKQLLILLHGLGANAKDLFGLVPYLQKELPDCHFVSLNAPFACDMAPSGYQWFSLQKRNEQDLIDGLRIAGQIVDNYIDEKLEELGLKANKLALLGFSQGAMTSMYVSLRRKEQIAGILSYSGALIAPQLLETELKTSPPICAIHGEDDTVVPFLAFEEMVTYANKFNLNLSGYSQKSLGHGIDQAGLKIGLEFLKQIFV